MRIPLWVVGPLRVNGLYARGDYDLPLATSDPTLTETCRRGIEAVTEAGGATAMVLDEGIGRAYAFGFRTLPQAGLFAHWATVRVDAFRRVAAAADPEATVTDVRVTVEGNRVLVYLEFAPGDAVDAHRAPTEAIRAYIREQTPVRLLSDVTDDGDTPEMAAARPAPAVRGRRVSAEVILPVSVVGRAMAGGPGRHQAFVAALGALFLACGQDLVAVPGSAAGISRREVTAPGNLYAAVTLPHLIVGTVSGGTTLPSQRACLELLGLAGPGKAAALAEVCASLCLAADLGRDLPPR